MATRRVFIKHAAAAVASVAATQATQAANGNSSKYGSSRRVKSVFRREETVVRHGGVGDNFHMSWARDDRQYVSLCDGLGWNEKPQHYYNSRLFAIEGGPRDATFHDVPGYPLLEPAWNEPRYYNFGTLALDGSIYQFLTTSNHPWYRPDGSPWLEDLNWVGAKLIYSPDNGRTWCNQDGSTPVVWEDWSVRSRNNMVFFDEPNQAFPMLSILQMGRNYEANRDGYVYVYGPNGNIDGLVNELVMFRVPKKRILDRSAYEYFSGRRPNGDAKWDRNLDARTAVHVFPRGWAAGYSWLPSVVYCAPIGLYLMTSWGTGVGPDNGSFGKPSYLGFWTSPSPWGPWAQIHEETAWMPGGDPNARAYQPQIAPKWIAPDGKSFWLVWTDYQLTDKEFVRKLDEERIGHLPTLADEVRWAMLRPKYRPYYSFNTQRVDLVLA